MSGKKVFVSFDYDNDSELKLLFTNQARWNTTDFSFSDQSLKEAVSGDWQKVAEQKIKNSDMVIVLCGEHMRSATGVDSEIRLARKNNKRVVYVAGRREKSTLPSAADTHGIMPWNEEKLTALLTQ